MKAQAKFNVRGAGWIELRRPGVGVSKSSSVVIEFCGIGQDQKLRVLQFGMSKQDALDLAARLIRSAGVQGPESGSRAWESLADTGRNLLESQICYLKELIEPLDAGGALVQSIQRERERISSELDAGRYLPEIR